MLGVASQITCQNSKYSFYRISTTFHAGLPSSLMAHISFLPTLLLDSDLTHRSHSTSHYLTLTSHTAHTQPHRHSSYLHRCFSHLPCHLPNLTSSLFPSHFISLDLDIHPSYHHHPMPQPSHCHCLHHCLPLSLHTDLTSITACPSALTPLLPPSVPAPLPSHRHCLHQCLPLSPHSFHSPHLTHHI